MAKKPLNRELLGIPYEGDGIGGFTFSCGGRHYLWQSHGILHDDTDNAAPVFLGHYARVEVAIAYVRGIYDGGNLMRASLNVPAGLKERSPRVDASSVDSGDRKGQ